MIRSLSKMWTPLRKLPRNNVVVTVYTSAYLPNFRCVILLSCQDQIGNVGLFRSANSYCLAVNVNIEVISLRWGSNVSLKDRWISHVFGSFFVGTKFIPNVAGSCYTSCIFTNIVPQLIKHLYNKLVGYNLLFSVFYYVIAFVFYLVQSAVWSNEYLINQKVKVFSSHCTRIIFGV